MEKCFNYSWQLKQIRSLLFLTCFACSFSAYAQRMERIHTIFTFDQLFDAYPVSDHGIAVTYVTSKSQLILSGKRDLIDYIDITGAVATLDNRPRYQANC